MQIVHQKTAACLCLTTVKNEDKMEFSKILEAIKVRSLFIFNCCACAYMKFITVCIILYRQTSTTSMKSTGRSGEVELWDLNLRPRPRLRREF